MEDSNEIKPIRPLFTLRDTDVVERIRKLPPACYYLVFDKRVYEDLDELGAAIKNDKDKLIQLLFRLVGGKGGE